MKLQIKKSQSLEGVNPIDIEVQSKERSKKQDIARSIDNVKNIRLLSLDSVFSTLTVDSHEFEKLPVFKLQKAEVIGEELKFETSDTFDQALQDGFFLVKIPPKMDVISGDQFSHNFYKKKNGYLNDNYRGFQHVLLDQS